ncbi:AAA family ATPase [Mycobacterium sp. NPDC006124]|uniref:helix-turn-helix transcriptional regulator n=1 Tax=Mycobacterium sp. NPDC006124 TaxID=3156729 RepID=UPI0033A265E0
MAHTVLRGRSDAMSRALTALRRASSTGQGALIVISGEPGIGKSAVMREVVEQAARSGFKVGSGKAEQGDQIAPGAPLLVSLRSGRQPLLPGEAFASLAPLYDKPLWLVDRISSLLEEMALTAPVVIAVDDVQWSDRLTRFALRVLPSRLAGSPVVWVLTSRWAPTGPVQEVIAGTDDVTAITRISLGPLGPGDIESLASDRLGVEPSDHVKELLHRVGGNPFWAVQVLEGLARRRERGQGVGDLASELSAGVRERMAELSDQTAALVRLVAVWGRPLPASDAGRLLGDLSDAQMSLLVRDGVDHGLLGTVDGEVLLPHDLVGEAVYADIAPAQRRDVHRACARYLLGEGRPALAAATHYRASAVQDDEEAILALEAAAGECLVSMPEQAAELAQQAFGLTSPRHPLWLVTGTRTVETLVNAQREGRALALADRLLQAATEPEVVGRIELQACRALWCLGDCVPMERRAGAAMALPGVSAVLRAQLSSARALAASRTRSAPSTESMAQAALAEGRRVGDDYSQRLAVIALIEAARNEGRHRLALDRFADLRRLSDTAYEVEEIRTLQHLDAYDDAEALLAKIREAHDDVDELLPSMLYAQMWQDHNLARFDAAEAGARTLLRLADETDNHGYRLNARMVLSAVASYRGEIIRATELLEPVEGECQSSDGERSPRAGLMRGWMKASAGDLAGARAILGPLLDRASDARDPWPWTPPWMRILADIGLAAGDRDIALAASRLADAAARRNPGVPSLDGVALHVRGLLAEDPEVLAAAVDALRASPRPMLLADALKDLGSASLRAGKSAEAVDALAEAAEIYQRVGATAGGRVIANLLRGQRIKGIRVSPPEPRPHSGWASLTPTELRVVELIGTGYTNRAAAEALGVSTNTVNTHLRAVFRKLGVKSRVQLTIAWGGRSTDDGVLRPR